MTKDYTRAVLESAQQLQRLELAAALPVRSRFDFRAGWAALLAALISLIPSISAAQILI